MKKFLITSLLICISLFSFSQAGTVTLSDRGDVYNCGGFVVGITVYPLADGHYPGLYAIDFKDSSACDTCWTHKWDRGFPGSTLTTPAQLYQTWCPNYEQTYSLFGGINPKGAKIRIREHKEYVDLIGPAAEAVWTADRWDDSKWMPWSNVVTLGESKAGTAKGKGKKK